MKTSTSSTYCDYSLNFGKRRITINDEKEAYLPIPTEQNVYQTKWNNFIRMYVCIVCMTMAMAI